MKRHIYLSGFMGSGKTTVGKILAQQLDLPFYDTDSLIEKKLGRKIREIFSRKGEFFFRSEEHQILVNLQKEPSGVVALGGGLVLSEANRVILKRGLWFNLKVNPTTTLKRIGKTTGRPLIPRHGKGETIDRLLNCRRPYYNLAPWQVETDSLTKDAVAGIIRHEILCL